MIELGSDDQW